MSGIVKLDDANEAGGKNADKCTLILTEGDSAKTLAVSGLSVVGRDRYGVFPLKGKPLNVREATHKQIMDNVEFGHIMEILGLKPNIKYESTKGLRYGRLMIMTDQVRLLFLFSLARRFVYTALPRPAHRNSVVAIRTTMVLTSRVS